MEDPVAIWKWELFVDHIIISTADNLRIKKLLKRDEYEGAVLLSLQIWKGYGKDPADLVKVLEQLELNSLIGWVDNLHAALTIYYNNSFMTL